MNFEIKRSSRRLWKDISGATATEYAFIITFIAIASSAGMVFMGASLSTFYNDVGSALSEMACAMPENASERGEENSNKCKDKSP